MTEWCAGILLGGFLAGYLYRWYCTAVKIDPYFPYKILFHVEANGKKWIVINPATPWHVLEAIYILLFRKLGRKPKREIEASNDRRVQILRKLWIATASTVFFLGTISVSAEEFPYLFRIHIDHPPHKQYASEEVKQDKPDQEGPKQNLTGSKPQPSSVNESASQELSQELQQDPPKLKPIANEKKPLHKDEVRKLNERLHRVNQRLNKIENKLAAIEKTLPNTTSNIDVKPLNRLMETISEVNKTIAEVNQIEKQIPALTNETINGVNETINGTINGVNELQKQIIGILR